MNPDEEVPPPQGDPILDKAKQLRAAGVSVDDIAGYLKSKGYLADGSHQPAQPKAQSPAAAAGHLPAIQKAGDDALGQALADQQSSTPERLAAHALNTAQGIPGMEAGEAAMGAVGSRIPGVRQGAPLSFGQSRDALRSQTGTIGGKTSFVEKALGGSALLPFLPKNPALAGGALGAADQALSADDESAGRRAFGTVAGGVGGAAAGQLVGKVVQGGSNMLRSALAQNPTENILGRQAARAASAKVLYDAAAREGQQVGGSQAISQFLSEDDIAPIVSQIRASRQGGSILPDSPEMLDLVYKELSDQSGNLKKALAVPTPRSANSKQFQTRELGLAKDQALKAADTSMPAYRDAVEDYARQSGNLDAFGTGYTAQHGASAGHAPALGGLLKKTPQGLAAATEKATPEGLSAATEGVLGRRKLGAPAGGMFKKALSTDPTTKNLRALGANNLTDILQQLGITTANSPFASP